MAQVLVEACERTFTVDQIHLDDRHGPLTRREILRWLLERDLVCPNGTQHTYELTERGRDLARETATLELWIRT